MTLLLPLGLLGLLGVVALIIIYIIKPNYQQKFISSTFVWKLSLKYKKKRLPISKLRNILLILCQVLMLISLALILAKPAIVLKEQTDADEVIAIIDASASMRTETDYVTRFEKAVSGVQKLANDVIVNKKGIVSIITAGEKPDFIVHRASGDGISDVDAILKELVEEDTLCTYGNANIDEAIGKCDDILRENPNAKIYLFTDKDYEYPPSTVKIENVSGEEEWNAAILDAAAEMEDNSYVFSVELAVYGIDAELDLTVSVYGVNPTSTDPDGVTREYKTTVECFEDNAVTVIFKYYDEDASQDVETDNIIIVPLGESDRAYIFDYANISLDVDDNFPYDNNFSIYGGKKDEIKVLYASPLRNSFVSSMLDILTYRNTDNWDVKYEDPRLDAETEEGYLRALSDIMEEGSYDLYIFEHIMPKQMPKNGVVLMINPDKAPQGAEFAVRGEVTVPNKQSLPLTLDTEGDPLLRNVDVEGLTVSKYRMLENISGGYDILASCDGKPVIIARKDGNLQTAVLAFSEHYSNITITLSFPMFILNFFKYYFPDAVDVNSVEVYRPVSINSRSESVNISGYDFDSTLSEFPADITFDVPGSYLISQTTYFNKFLSSMIFVKIPSAESNITAKGDTFESPYYLVDDSEFYKDLLLYLEIAVVALLFAEWILHLREGA